MKRIFVDASNIHTGGGKVLLDDFLHSAADFKSNKFIVWVDKRYQISPSLVPLRHIVFKRVTIWGRLKLKICLKQLGMENDVIIYFGNIPPFNKSKCKSILMQNNRLVVDWLPVDDSVRSRFRLLVERLLFKVFKNNVDEVIVQSRSMKFLIGKMKNTKFNTRVLAYKNLKEFTKIVPRAERDGLIYVSSDDPHKNHQILFEAWILLSHQQIFPKLKLTLSKKSNLVKLIKKIKNLYGLDIDILYDLKRTELLKEFAASRALVFPSLIESYGLPLVEANMLGLDIIAPELDYVRDVVDPVETFDPNSALSIGRAVKRYLGYDEDKTKILDPSDFISFIKK